LRICFCCPLIEGYGQTEALGLQFTQSKYDYTTGNVGGILSHLEFKLIDVPEMKYFTNNKTPDGEPNPKGEVLVRGNGVILGYYKQTQKYRDTVDEDGWLHSGDIAELLPGSNALKIIDRSKNIFK